MKKTLDHYVYLTLCDLSITEFKTNHQMNVRSFSTFRGFCNYLHSEIKGKRVKNFMRYVQPLSKELRELYGFPEKECLQYVLRFFNDKMYEKYEKPISMYRAEFNKFL